MCEENIYKGEDLDAESISLNEVCRKGGIILYESSNQYENDCYAISTLKELFPDFDFKEDKNYYIEKDDVFINGDDILNLLY